MLLDASVWISAADPDEERHVDSAGLFELAVEGRFNLAALDLTLYEVANAAISKWRNRDKAAELSERVELACVGRLVRSDSELIGGATTIATTHSISVYDATYVAASQACRWPLVSNDVRNLVSNGLAVLPRDALS